MNNQDQSNECMKKLEQFTFSKDKGPIPLHYFESTINANERDSLKV